MKTKMVAIATWHYTNPGIAVGLACVCVCVCAWTISFERSDPSFVVCIKTGRVE